MTQTLEIQDAMFKGVKTRDLFQGRITRVET